MIIETEKGKIERGDRMFAEVNYDGRTVAEFFDNRTIGSMAEVFSLLFQKVTGCRGIVDVVVSNRTRGWTEKLAIVMGQAYRRAQAMSREEMIEAGLMERNGQLCINFN